ncbi:MAG: trehalose-6-phosphate synthase [Actinomycetota bacterium]|nr:trehalose-6-phosphate synthase [Actinomycetota bacterium]
MSSLVVVANRLPVRRSDDGSWQTSPGGLVSALQPVLAKLGGAWVGWTGDAGEAGEAFDHEGMHIVPVPLDASEIENHYLGFSNASLWPLYHDAIREAEFHRHWWRPHVAVNRRFAKAAAEVAEPGSVVWVHDYQLQLVPGMLRELRDDVRIGFFLHIPFPPVEVFARMPWRTEVLDAVLGADLLGFQTRTAAANFARTAVRHGTGVKRVKGGSNRALDVEGRTVRLDAYPISIDPSQYEKLATDPDIVERAAGIKEAVGHRRLVFGVDRLDYSKGITHRLRAFEELLRRGDATSEDTVFLQSVVPSREGVDAYAELRSDVEELVGRINGDHGAIGRDAVIYLRQNLDPRDLVAHYLAADVLAVTPVRDGMNLIALEYLATRVDDDGALLLSEFAGAAEWLGRYAVLINPYDVDGSADGLLRALSLDDAARRKLVRGARRTIDRNSVHDWARRFLGDLGAEADADWPSDELLSSA